MKSRLDRYLDRIDPNQFSVKNPYVPISLFANDDVPVEVGAIEQIIKFASLQKTMELLAPYFGECSLERVVLTPDFHEGESGIPIGTVAKTRGFILPQAVGNDICCGMRLLVTDVTKDELAPHVDRLMPILRGIFFQGKREVIMSPRQREALLRDGLWGLIETVGDNRGSGIWRYYDEKIQEKDLLKVHFQGNLPTNDIYSFGDYIKQSGASDSRDAQAGVLGGNNHFTELQTIEDVFDGAYGMGLEKNKITIMVHTGSVGIGHAVGWFFKDQAIDLYPKHLKRPDHGFFPIPAESNLASAYLSAMNNAANFAFGNRMFLGLMVIRALSEVLGREIGSKLVYDAPHNLIWKNSDGSFIHRKGATPAYKGIPCLVPGSMAAASYVLEGQGNEAALCSACHGAGRAISRGKARHMEDVRFREQMAPLRVVNPIDPNAPEVRNRRDILKEYDDRLKEESGDSYKAITPIAATINDAGIAKTVAKLWPILTIKG